MNNDVINNKSESEPTTKSCRRSSCRFVSPKVAVFEGKPHKLSRYMAKPWVLAVSSETGYNGIIVDVALKFGSYDPLKCLIEILLAPYVAYAEVLTCSHRT